MKASFARRGLINRRVAVVGAVITLAAGASFTSSPATAGPIMRTAAAGSDGAPRAASAYDPTRPGPYDPAEISSRADFDGVSEQEAASRLRLEDAASALERSAHSRWPETFAGLWIEDGQRVVVAFTDGVEERVADLRAEFPFPDALHGKQSQHSYDKLRRVQNLMIEERNHLSHGRPRSQASQEAGPMPDPLRATKGEYALNIDVPSNEVVIIADDQPDEVLTSARQRYLPAIQMRGGMPKPECTRKDCKYSMRGGLALVLGTMPQCTTGFSAYGPATGRRFFLTAGHCAGSGTWSQGGASYGDTDRADVDNYVDAMRVVATNSTWEHVGRVWVTSSDQRAIHFYQQWSSIAIGTQVGKSGKNTGTTRGSVTGKDYAPYGGTGRSVTANYCSTGGDSGGSIFRNDVAWGLHTGSNSGTNPCGTRGHFAYFSAMDFILARLSVELFSA